MNKLMHYRHLIRAISMILFLTTSRSSASEEEIKVNLPLVEHGLHYTTPAMTWDEALPLGNGILGALIWGDGKLLKISLDRTDLWDLRKVPEFHSPEYTYKTMQQWHKEGRT